MIALQQIIVGSGTACALAAFATHLKLLTRGGGFAAAVVGAIVFGLGGLPSAVPLVVFFGTSNALGRWRRAKKAMLGFEKSGARDAAQVIANGGVAALAVLVASLLPGDSSPLHIAFGAAVAEANADTWATEIGSGFGGQTRMITSLKNVGPGRSGGVSLLGTCAALGGSALIAATLAAAGPATVRDCSIVALCGLGGCLADSALGATVQAHYEDSEGRLTERHTHGARLVSGISGVNNDIVNGLGTLAAAAAAFALSLTGK